jgi:hypothetical protein
MKRRRIFSALFGCGLLAKIEAQQLGKKPIKKFYVTGLAHTKEANDCTIPPIICYGTDRLDALLHCCEGGGLTVWTEEEWNEWMKRGGREFEATCKEELRREKGAPR